MLVIPTYILLAVEIFTLLIVPHYNLIYFFTCHDFTSYDILLPMLFSDHVYDLGLLVLGVNYFCYF